MFKIETIVKVTKFISTRFDNLGLTNMLKGIYLQVILRIPVRIKNYTRICCSQVNAQTTGSGAQKEDKAVGIRFAEPVNCSLSEIPSDSPIDSFI